MKDLKINPDKIIHDLKREDLRDKKLKKACKEFESIFTYEILKSMRRTVQKCNLFHGGQGEEIYESLLDQELSKKMAGGANSLASQLYSQLRRNNFSGIRGEENDQLGDPDLRGAIPLWPIKGRLSSEFGVREDPINGRSHFHYGIDLAKKKGAIVRASLPGRVIESGFQEGYGNLVVLNHGHGFTTLYGHNEGNLVKKGDWVNGGEPIAKVGSTGRSTGPHLHFEVRKHGRHLNPVEFLEATSDTL